MSNYLAIASVTAVLKHMLQAAVGADVDGATVTTVRPDGSGNGTPGIGVNIYLYQVSPNVAWRNADLPARRSDGQLAQRPAVALDLHYLLSFYGADNQLEPQRLLGSAVRALHARPVLTRQLIRDAKSDAGFDHLAASDLDDAVELVKLTLLPLSLEELSKLWSIFFQTAYVLSVAYQGSLVLIEGDEQVQAAPPVLQRRLYIAPLREPPIEGVGGAESPPNLSSAGQPSGPQVKIP